MDALTSDQQSRVIDFADGAWVVDRPDDPDGSRQDSDFALARILDSVESPHELFEMIVRYDFELGRTPLIRLIDHPLTDAGVALLLYWRWSPDFYARKRSESDLRPYQHEGWQGLQHIHEVLLRLLEQPTTTHFDPTCVDFLNGRDLTERARKYPSRGWYTIPDRFFESV